MFGKTLLYAQRYGLQARGIRVRNLPGQRLFTSTLHTLKGSDEELIAHSEDETEVDSGPTKANKQNIMQLTQKVMTSVSTGDFETYSKLVDACVTCFEPVSVGNLVEGMDFHKFYFDTILGKKAAPTNTTILSPHVHMLGEDAACICYVRLQQFINSDGVPYTKQREITRVWHKRSGNWVNVHLHCSNMTQSPN